MLVERDLITMRREGRYEQNGQDAVFEADGRTLEPFSHLRKIDTPACRILQACFEF